MNFDLIAASHEMNLRNESTHLRGTRTQIQQTLTSLYTSQLMI